MTRLAPFWRYYGGKYRAAPRYPAPEYTTIVEPFAGAAGYSTRYFDRQVILCEIYPVITEMWRFLISASPDDIRSIPLTESIKSLPSWVPDGARYLVGFSLNDASVAPCNVLSAGKIRMALTGRKYEGWNFAKRERIASQVQYIKHWTIYRCSYEELPNIEATWFVDPPYSNKAGSHYIHSKIDYKHLADWCLKRSGQLIVCENEGALWLPFKSFFTFKAGITKKGNAAGSKEVIFMKNDNENSRVLHTSLRDVKRIGIDNEFPNYPPSIGLIVRKGIKGYQLTTHSPKLSSTVTGETFEAFEFISDSDVQNRSDSPNTHNSLIDDLDTHIRSGLLTEAHNCRILAADLIEHAKRLESESRKDVLIEEKNTENNNLNLMPQDKNHANKPKSVGQNTRIQEDGPEDGPENDLEDVLEDDLDIFD